MSFILHFQDIKYNNNKKKTRRCAWTLGRFCKMASHGERKNKDRERQTKEIKVLLFLLYISSLFTLRFCEFLFLCIFSSYLEKKRAEEGGGQCYFFAREEKKLPEKKAKNNPKIDRERLFFPREDFRKFTPEKPKIVPEKKNEKLCPRKPKSAREKNGSNFFVQVYFA